MAKRATRKLQDNEILVFIASPGDLAVERRAFKDVIDELNAGFGDGIGRTFKALGWEDTLASTGRRSQGVINLEIDRCDVFVLAMHRRWGQEAPDAAPYSSYTEEEFHRAYARWKDTKAPEIFVFFKRIDPEEMASPGEPLEKVLDFRRSLENTRHVFYRVFDSKRQFKGEINRHLRAFAKGELPQTDAPLEGVLLPLTVIEAVTKERAEKEDARRRAELAERVADTAVARAEALALEFAERAGKAALEGRVEVARQDFARALDGTTNLRIISLAVEFFHRTGDLTMAEGLLERWLAISDLTANSFDTADALARLGLIYRERKDLERAEELFRKALAIDEKLGCGKRKAADYANLGLIHRDRGELDLAEALLRKALVNNEQLGNLRGVAHNYGNLGVLFRTRGELDQAEEMNQKALELEEHLGCSEGVAIQSANLGMIFKARGELDRAEEMYRKALTINEQLGRLKGMANQFNNLGSVHQIRGQLERAEEMFRNALAINEQLGRLHAVPTQFCNLGMIYRTRGKLQLAKEMYRNALDVNEQLDRLESIASVCITLGEICQMTSDLESTRMHWTKARELFTRVKNSQMATEVQERIDNL